jgi:hypothetical protein
MFFAQYSSTVNPAMQARQLGIIAKQQYLFGGKAGQPYFPGYFAQYSFSVMPSVQAMHCGVSALQQTRGC